MASLSLDGSRITPLDLKSRRPARDRSRVS
jgi:hypothetical protein